jgi:hypothetical protein
MPQVIWTKLLGGSGNDYAISLTTGSDGAIYVAGYTSGNLDGQVNSGGVDAFVTKYNTDGTKAWTKLLGSSVNDYAQSLTTGSDGAIYVAGYTDGNLDGQVNSGSIDAFVVKLNDPVITSAATATFAENGTGTVYTITATSIGTNQTSPTVYLVLMLVSLTSIMVLSPSKLLLTLNYLVIAVQITFMILMLSLVMVH